MEVNFWQHSFVTKRIVKFRMGHVAVLCVKLLGSFPVQVNCILSMVNSDKCKTDRFLYFAFMYL